ncbi:hypothetical protein IJ843_04425 [bacterium]|nr:hypothetical protein [bacterium]
MSISSVNFAGAANFQDRIRQPQAFTRPDTALASTGINNGDEEKSSTGKTIAKVVAAAALTAGALGAGKKYGVFNKGESEKLNKVKDVLGGWGQKVLDATDYVINKAKAAKNWVVEKFSSKKPDAPDAKPAETPQLNAGTKPAEPQTPGDNVNP